ncbi:MAG: hypothetical protein U0842_05260 [Candidatus Binatia bacterium]
MAAARAPMLLVRPMPGRDQGRSRRRACVAAALGCLLAGGPAFAAGDAWRADLPCGRVLDAPHAASKQACAAAACVALPDGGEVCTCKGATDGDLRISVVRGGAEAPWPIEPMLGEVTAFRVALADLDGDAHDELVISVLDAVSNGMAVQSWTTCVLDARDPSRARACVPANDVPFLSMPAGPPRGAKKVCRLLDARWRWGSEPHRGDGLYLVGRWLTYRDGALQTDPQRPTIARRYLYRFAAERGDALDNERTAPILWWQDATTRALRCPADPLCREGDEPQ